MSLVEWFIKANASVNGSLSAANVLLDSIFVAVKAKELFQSFLLKVVKQVLHSNHIFIEHLLVDHACHSPWKRQLACSITLLSENEGFQIFLRCTFPEGSWRPLHVLTEGALSNKRRNKSKRQFFSARSSHPRSMVEQPPNHSTCDCAVQQVASPRSLDLCMPFWWRGETTGSRKEGLLLKVELSAVDVCLQCKTARQLGCDQKNRIRRNDGACQWLRQRSRALLRRYTRVQCTYCAHDAVFVFLHDLPDLSRWSGSLSTPSTGKRPGTQCQSQSQGQWNWRWCPLIVKAFFSTEPVSI